MGFGFLPRALALVLEASDIDLGMFGIGAVMGMLGIDADRVDRPIDADAVRRTIASVGCSSLGSGTSSRRISPTAWKTTAFMART